MNERRRCATCDAWYNDTDAAEVRIHQHPEPQSGPPRDAWRLSGLPYERWIEVTEEGRRWKSGETKHAHVCPTCGTGDRIEVEQHRNQYDCGESQKQALAEKENMRKPHLHYQCWNCARHWTTPLPTSARDQMWLQEMCELVRNKIPDSHAFVVFALPIAGTDRLYYASNAKRKDAIRALKEWIAHQEESADNWLKHDTEPPTK